MPQHGIQGRPFSGSTLFQHPLLELLLPLPSTTVSQLRGITSHLQLPRWPCHPRGGCQHYSPCSVPSFFFFLSSGFNEPSQTSERNPRQQLTHVHLYHGTVPGTGNIRNMGTILNPAIITPNVGVSVLTLLTFGVQ